MVLAAVVAVVLAVAAPALPLSPSANNSGKLVDIGGGREMYMECQGKGSPTVVFVSGAGTAPKHGARHSTHQSRRCCPRSPKPTGYAPTTVPELFSRQVKV
jgi:hypothetical protein